MASSDYKTIRGTTPFPYTRISPYFLVISLCVFLASVYFIAVKGMNFGVDFLGGAKILVQFESPTESQAIRDALKHVQEAGIEVIAFGNESEKNTYMLRAHHKDQTDWGSLILTELNKTLADHKPSIQSQEIIGPKVGADLKMKGLLSILTTCIAIMIYIGFRFDFFFAPGAIMALFHDVMISAGFFAYTGREFNLPILAALLTILGYSNNDTIIIYDRIRENIARRLSAKLTLSEIINISLTETFSRTIITSLTVFFVVVVMFLKGGPVLNDFAFCLMIGVLIGTYSSLFIASPAYLLLVKLFPKQANLALKKYSAA